VHNLDVTRSSSYHGMTLRAQVRRHTKQQLSRHDTTCTGATSHEAAVSTLEVKTITKAEDSVMMQGSLSEGDRLENTGVVEG
jgi:hypothetical protein